MKKSFSILVILRTDKKGIDGRCPLNVQVRLNSKVIKLPNKRYTLLNGIVKQKLVLVRASEN